MPSCLQPDAGHRPSFHEVKKAGWGVGRIFFSVLEGRLCEGRLLLVVREASWVTLSGACVYGVRCAPGRLFFRRRLHGVNSRDVAKCRHGGIKGCTP